MAPINVCVTGAAGQIAYSLLPMICRGDVFGPDQDINLKLLDIKPMLGALDGVMMELSDCGFDLVSSVVATDDPMEGFKDCDAAFLIGAMPRREGMLRKDLLEKNAGIFQVQGAALDKVAKRSVRVVVVGNPANTNALITSTFAPNIPKSQFTALTNLDQTRARAMIAERAGVKFSQVKNVIIWGNHSSTQYPDIEHAVVVKDGKRTPVKEAIGDVDWLRGDFIKAVQTRGAAVIKARKQSSAMSAAKAVADHMHTWWFGTPEGEYTSMGVVTEGGKYNVEDGLVYSLPVTIDKAGKITVVEGLDISDFSRDKMLATEHELKEERGTALQITK